MLSISESEKLLEWANSKNPGPWYDHSKFVANICKEIALACKIDAEKAYIIGLLHDIGRYVGPTEIMHIYDGYILLMDKGCSECAKVALTHSFPINDISYYSGKIDCSEEVYAFIDNFLKNAKYDDFDKLVQLADSLAVPTGPVLLEKRLVDVALRHGINEKTILKWKSLYDIYNYFCDKANMNIYKLFPNIKYNTFLF